MNHWKLSTSLFALMAAVIGTPAHATDPYDSGLQPTTSFIQSNEWSGFYSGRHIGGAFGNDTSSRRASVNGSSGGGGGGGGGGAGAALMDQAGLAAPVEVEQTGLTELMVVPMTAAMVVAVAAGEMVAPCQPILVTTMTP